MYHNLVNNRFNKRGGECSKLGFVLEILINIVSF